MKVTFTPAPLVAVNFPAGTVAGALVVLLESADKSFSQHQTSDGTTMTTFSQVPPTGAYSLTYGMRKPDDSDWISPPFVASINVTPDQVSIPVPNVQAGGTTLVSDDV